MSRLGRNFRRAAAQVPTLVQRAINTLRKYGTAAHYWDFGISQEKLAFRRNLLLQTDTLATQSVTVAARQCVLSFYGIGTLTLSGVSTAGPLVGTGASDRVSLTFTPTAGSLTLTVSGSVLQAQLEYAP